MLTAGSAPGREQCGEVEDDARQPRHRCCRRTLERDVSFVLSVAQGAINQQRGIIHVHDPDFGNAMPRVQRHFDVAIVVQRRIADFDDEQRVRARRELAAVEVGARRPLPIGAMSMISPSINSTRASGASTPTSAMRW